MTQLGGREKYTGERWGDGAVSRAQVERFVDHAGVEGAHRESLVQAFLEFPPGYLVRGVFFEGEARMVMQRLGTEAWRALLRDAGTPARITPFGSYVFRDLYKVHVLVARTLWPEQPLPRALGNISRRLYPIFRESLVGKTMSALYTPDAATFLELMARAYSICVVGNTHVVRRAGDRAMRWSATVEPIPWFAELFAGIVEGALASHGLPGVKVTTLEAHTDRVPHRYELEITW